MFALACVSLFGTTITGPNGRRANYMTGQTRQVSVSDRRVLAAARFAVAEFNRINPEAQFLYNLVNITSAEVQVVSLLGIFPGYAAGPCTGLREGHIPASLHSPHSIQVCAINGGAKTEGCEVEAANPQTE
ncbi:uncharacterized protein LOC144061768 [Vanacampus margaritifer]